MSSDRRAPGGPAASGRSWLASGLRLMCRPELWATAAVALWRLAPPGWWHRWPPLPLPDKGYLRFRMLTAYGDAGARPDGTDLVAYLEWCRRMGVLRGGH